MNEKIIGLVISEATKLKSMATKKELCNLKIHILDSSCPFNCIYGQMTKSCYSERAAELIKACCERVYESGPSGGMPISIEYATLNRAPYDFTVHDMRRPYYSPIEIFIDIEENKRNGNNAALISFLRGETDTLTLSTDF